MSISLKDIIQECYLKVRNSELNSLIHSKYQIAGLILGEMYNKYENGKDKEILIELMFFLNTKNVIHHLINILDNSGDFGTMTLNNAIILEYKQIQLSREPFSFSTPLSIIEKCFSAVDESELRNREYKRVIIERIINTMIEDRMNGILNEDGKEILKQDTVYELIEMIIDRIIVGEEIRISINEVFSLIEDKKKQQENNVEDIKKEILDEFRNLMAEVHLHIDHVGKSTFAAISASSPVDKSPTHGKYHGKKTSSLFSDF